MGTWSQDLVCMTPNLLPKIVMILIVLNGIVNSNIHISV